MSLNQSCKDLDRSPLRTTWQDLAFFEANAAIASVISEQESISALKEEQTMSTKASAHWEDVLWLLHARTSIKRLAPLITRSSFIKCFF